MALTDNLPCFKHADFLKRLSTNYAEAPVAIGLTTAGRVMELLAAENGTWTIIVTAPNGVSCGVVAGEAFELLPPPKRGEES